MSEDKLQAAAFQWFWNEYPLLRRTLWAVPNGGTRHLYEAAKLKATGVIAGVHDLHFIHAGVFYTFELKFGSNRLTEEQKIFWQAIIQQGGKCFEIRDLLQFQQIIRTIVQVK